VRVLHVLRKLDVGGAELLALTLAGWSTKQGVQVAISSQRGELETRVPVDVELFHRDHDTLPLLIGNVIRHARQYEASILHAHQRREALACVIAARLLNIRAVEHAHTEIPSRHFKALSYRSDCIFAVSDSVRAMVIDDFQRHPDRVTVVDNVPVQVSNSKRPWADVHDSSTINLVAIGRVDPQKDPHRFIRVISAVANKRSVKATWIGDGPLLAKMRRITRDSDFIDFVGPSTQVAQALAGADALVMTSAWEGLPLVILEALAAGTPVIATDVSGTKDIVGAHACGTMVSSDSSDEEFAHLILDTLTNRVTMEEMSQRGLDLIQRRFSADVAFAPILNIYRALL
jgi:glycosyltransferase involved in cell wall biosynthesis